MYGALEVGKSYKIIWDFCLLIFLALVKSILVNIILFTCKIGTVPSAMPNVQVFERLLIMTVYVALLKHAIKILKLLL